MDVLAASRQTLPPPKNNRLLAIGGLTIPHHTDDTQ